MDLSNERVSYDADGIDVDAMANEPFAQFETWFAEAVESGEPEPYAMVLSTVDEHGKPRGRSVLLRGVDHGFVFYTNYESAKAKALESSGLGALSFRWFGVHRQVHVEGGVERVSAAESDTYFAKRPRESQLGAWASAQSSEIASRDELVARLSEATARFADESVERPPFWGGYRIIPSRVEFWQGQPSRLHDRIVYTARADSWSRSTLSP